MRNLASLLIALTVCVLVMSTGSLQATVDTLPDHDSVASQRPQVLTHNAQLLLDNAAPDEFLNLIVILTNQPAGPISRQVFARINSSTMQLTNDIQAITRRALPHELMSPEEERHFVPTALEAGDLETRRILSGQLDDLHRNARREIANRIAEAVADDQAELGMFIEELGGMVTSNITSMSILGVSIPAGKVEALADHHLVALIEVDIPGVPELDNHRHSLGLETGFWAAGIDGGVHDVGVLDTGVEQDHPALSSHNFLSNMGVHDDGTHGTGMAGILASTDTTFRGMAYGLDTIVVARAGTISTSMEGMDYIASTGEPENCNYSFGNGTADDTDYGPSDQFFDGVIDTYGYMVSKSTGNGGWGTTTITHPAPAYNLMASANMDDQNTITRADDVITSSSSTGPTLGGRKKPDITAPGTNSMSCHPSGGFSNIGGTSSASPHTGGGIVLLYDMGVTNVMAGKAILLNTTDAIDNNGTSTTSDDVYVNGSHWNARYGWGYLNLGAAYLHGLDYFLDEIPDAPEDADFKLYKGQMFTYEKATLVWQRHVAYNGSTYPEIVEDLSDLNLFAYREADDTLLTESTSAIDNVEQLHVEEDGVVVLKVEASGSFDPDITLEQFALATQEQFSSVNGPQFSVDFTHPGNVPPYAVFDVEIDVENTGDSAAHAVAAELSGVSIVSGSNPANLGTIAQGDTANTSWTVQASGEPGEHPITVTITSNSYAEAFTDLGESTYQVGCGPEDVNDDGVVNIDDIFAVLGLWGDCPDPCPPYCPGDITEDCTVNIDDIFAILGEWGPCE